ncbi:MAG: DUF3857 domain-containing protein [Chitinophagaceae bacterium]|nr:DUF3857 domain-containing protein [Chitinophagaceae bacterium]
MKATYLFLFFLLSVSIHIAAQKSQPGFGKVDKADLEMKDCEFDKGADAIVLIDYGNMYYDRGTVGFSTFKTVYERRTRIKILKEKGISQADIEINYYTHNNEEKVFKFNANTYNLDAAGKIITTEVKKVPSTQKIDGNYSKMIIAFPEVRVGSIIEYSYTIERESYGLRTWYFQGSIPVRYSEYQLRVPQIFRFSVQPSIVDPIEDKQEVVDESISMDEGFMETKSLKSNYIMRNLPGVKNEPFMGSPKDYMQRLEFQMTQIYYNESRIVDLSVKWQDVIKNRLIKDEDFGLQLEKTVTAAKPFIEEARQIADVETRMKFIYNRIRKSMSWNGDEDYVYTDNGIIKTWETKTGNVADINLLLVNLLNEAGVKTAPILFSTRDHGLVTPTYPSINQFNTVMAYVVLKDKAYVLDATDKVANVKLVPEKVVNTNGFIPEGENGRWKDVLSGKSKYKVMAAIQGEIDEAGIMKGNGLVNCYDYARAQRVKEWTQDNMKFKNDYFVTYYPGLKIEDIVVNNVDADSLPLEQKVKFSTVLNSSGEYRYFNINLFSDLEKNPFIAGTRVSDVDFGVHQEYTIFGNYTIPVGFTFDGIPENISMSTPDNGIIFSRTMQVESNLLNVRMTLEFKRTFYTADTYPEFKEFYKKLFDKLNEQVVIKKKATP